MWPFISMTRHVRANSLMKFSVRGDGSVSSRVNIFIGNLIMVYNFLTFLYPLYYINQKIFLLLLKKTGKSSNAALCHNSHKLVEDCVRRWEAPETINTEQVILYTTKVWEGL